MRCSVVSSSPPVTLADVARVAGVSKMTVSNVINERSGVSHGTRERVRAAIAATGYVVNPAARVLAGGRTRLIGVLVPSLGWPFVTEVVQGASTVAERAGFDLAIFTTSDRESVEAERVALLRSLADAVLMVLPAANEARILGGMLPVAAVEAGLPSLPHSVRADNHSGSRLAARHLFDLGHRRVAHICGQVSRRHDALERREGFLAEARGLGLSVPPEYLPDGNFSVDGGERAALWLLDLPEPPTAIFAANDDTAMGVLRAAQERHLRVPQDLSVVGFDDVALARLSRPMLTTVRQPLVEMGARAMSMLMQLLDGAAPPEVNPVFETTLVVRESTGPPGLPPH